MNRHIESMVQRIGVRIARQSTRTKAGGLLVVAAFAILGFLYVSAGRAATPTASIESESGTVASVSVVADTNASGGSAVRFGSGGSGSCTAPAGTLSVAVCGNKLVDQNGLAVQLRGVNRSGTQYMCVDGSGFFDGPTDSTSLGYIKAWGANAVRVSLNEDCWLGINGVAAAYGGTNYQNAIASYVGRLNALGFRVILDLHWAAPGTQQANSALDQLPMADRDHSPSFWGQVAAAYKNNHSVLFDLFNEPYPDSNKNTTAAWTCVRDGGSCPGVSYTVAGSQEMLNAIRGAGANNVVMVGGPQYAGVVDKWTQYKPSDTANQLAASIHIYYNTPADPEWAPCYLQSCWNNTMAPLAAVTPIVIGEVGERDCNHGLIDGTAISPVQPSLLDWADQHGIGYLAWSWIANGGGNCAAEPSLISDYQGTPTNYGIGIKNHLLNVANR
jgi:endoglucanase